MLIVAITATIFRVAYIERYQKEAAILNRLESTSGTVHKTSREPTWLWSQFGDQIDEKGASLVLSNTDISDNELADISQLTELGGLYLDRTRITDEGLQNIEDMKELVALSLRRTSITSWPPLSRMSRLVDLDLAFTNVKEVNTAGLASLETLNLRSTLITDQTLAKFGALPSLRTLDIAGSPGVPIKITDRGISHLTKDNLPKLSKIYLYFTEVSADGVAQLKAAFPGLVIVH